MIELSKAQSPKISVVIPTLGREELLLNCVDSILSGTFPDYEILIVDQNPEQTLKNKLSQRFPDEYKLRYFYRERAGAARARNFGLKEANGEIVVFIDDDLVVNPECLQAYFDLFQSINPPPAIVAGRIVPIWPGKRPEWFPQEREYILGLYDISDEVCLMPECDQPISANMAVLRDIILEIGGFNEDFGFDYSRKQPMIAGEDLLLGLSVRRAGYEIYYHPRAWVGHRISSSKLKKMNFLRRFFWEGVTVILEMESLGRLGSRFDHFIYHSKYSFKMLLLSIFPSLSRQFNDQQPSSSIRMLHLSQVFNSLGTLYAVINLNNLKRR